MLHIFIQKIHVNSPRLKTITFTAYGLSPLGCVYNVLLASHIIETVNQGRNANSIFA